MRPLGWVLCILMALSLGFPSRPALGETACKLRLIRGTATLNGNPLGRALQVEVNLPNREAYVVRIRGGTPPYRVLWTWYNPAGHGEVVGTYEYRWSEETHTLARLEEYNFHGVRVEDSAGSEGVFPPPPEEPMRAMFVGDVVESGKDTRVELIFPDGSVFRLKSETRMTLRNDGVDLQRGESQFTMVKQGKTFQVVTPDAVAGVDASAWKGNALAPLHLAALDLRDLGLASADPGGQFFVQRGPAGTAVYALRGALVVTDAAGRGRITVPQGQMTRVAPGAAPSSPQAYDAAALSRLLEAEGTVAKSAPGSASPDERARAREACKRAEALRDAERYEEAVALLNQAVRLDPGYWQAYLVRGYCFDMLQRYSEGIADYTRVLELHPDDLDALWNRGLDYRDTRQWQAMLGDFDRYLHLKDDRAGAWFQRGYAYGQLHETEKEIADYTRALELNPGHDGARWNRGRNYIELGRYQEALSDWERYLEAHPGNGDARFNRGLCYKNLGQKEKAMEDFAEAVRLMPELAKKVPAGYLTR